MAEFRQGTNLGSSLETLSGNEYMVHLMVHLPRQVLETGHVHYNWMYPIERQLGNYKGKVKNKCFPEGSVAEKYLAEEAINCRLYIGVDEHDEDAEVTHDADQHDIFIVSNVVQPYNEDNQWRLSGDEIEAAYWQVMIDCNKVTPYKNVQEMEYIKKYPNNYEQARRNNFHPFLLKWVDKQKRLEHTTFKQEIMNLARKPQHVRIYSACSVNGVMFITWEKDQTYRTQNFGIMVETTEGHFYGRLEEVVELVYANRMTVVLFKCKWFNTDPRNGSIKFHNGLVSVDTSTSWYQYSPFCLALTAKQVFYVNNPNLGEAWKVVNVMAHRNVFDATTLATENDNAPPVRFQDEEEAYKKIATDNGGGSIFNLTIDLHMEDREEEEEEEAEGEGEEEEEEEEEEYEDENEDEDEEEEAIGSEDDEEEDDEDEDEDDDY